MTEGYFIGLGDKTTCGGEVLDGDPRIDIHGLLHAREGDRVSCGKHAGDLSNTRRHFAYRESWQAGGWHAG
ncbi:PAAR domain-containing protein [Pseudomonas sp. EL_65y_Pfl1_R83]|uniref:PAAR domain-containing protein n=1 Tax=Pseudomonas sp. EL_65y_Pfl1_R83 TaxID=3088697 RepID=UPI00403F76E6